MEINFTNTFRYIRFLTAVKMLRITRFFKNIKTLRFMMTIVLKTIAPCLYLITLLFLFNYVYSLVGMQLYAGILNENDSRYSLNNFDTFWVAFLTVFNLITLNNWNDTLGIVFQSSAGKLISVLFIISWIIFGNFILLNILLAIILDGFTENLENENKNYLLDEEQQVLEEEELKNKFLSDQELTILLPKGAREAFMDELTKHYVKTIKMNPKEQDKDTQLIANLIMESQKKREKNVERNKESNEALCGDSLYFFHKSSLLRKKVIKIVYDRNFNLCVMISVIISCLIMIGETYADKNTNDNYDITVILMLKILNSLCLSVFFSEMFLKIIAFGFFLNQKSYLRKGENIMDVLIVFSYLLDLFLYETPYSELSITNVSKYIYICLKN